MNQNHSEEDRWMERVAEGDESALRLLVDRWERPVQAFLLRCLGNREDARDLAQETFLRVYRHASRYQGEGSFRAWLFRIAGNLCRSRQRRRRILRWLPLAGPTQAHEVPAPRAFDADAPHQAEELARALGELLEELPPRQRMAFVLRRQEELSYREIAEVLGTTASAVESLLVRATRCVQRGLRERGFGPQA